MKLSIDKNNKTYQKTYTQSGIDTATAEGVQLKWVKFISGIKESCPRIAKEMPISVGSLHLMATYKMLINLIAENFEAPTCELLNQG